MVTKMLVGNSQRFVLFAVLGWISFTDEKDPLCDAPLTIPTGKCCSRDYARYCCSGIPTCSDGGNNTEVERVVFGKPPCSSPWNLSACFGGFYSTNGKDTLPCPPGFFCEEYSVCLKPCPEGAFCIQNHLASGNCSGFEKCCLPDNNAPVFDTHSNSLLCAAQHYPVRCSAGEYCPNTTTMFKCPKGHFCREGSQIPRKCPVISPCAAGETSPNTLYVGLIINGCLLVTFFLILLYFNNQQQINFYFGLYTRRVTGNRKPSQKFKLSEGLRLAINRLPKYNAKDEEEIEPKKATYNISFDKLSLKLTSGSNKGKVLLQGVTGEVNAGEVTAVLGPSGAGKTTFLNVLCGKAYYGECGGTIKINGKTVKGFQDYKAITGFVPQEDIMHRSLTVREVLYYNALLRLPPQSDSKFYAKIVNKAENIFLTQIMTEILKLLGIRHVANTKIGDEETRGISGGQRRRVNVGMELVADPTILFLDEPTTGLDSSSSLAVVTALNTVASKGNLTVMCVIHQPRFEILKMFDKVLLLGRGGRTVYSGTVEGAEAYFTSIGYALPPYANPADFYMDVISGSIKNEKKQYASLFDEWESHQLSIGESLSTPSSRSNEENNSRSSSQLIINVKEMRTESRQSEESSTLSTLSSTTPTYPPPPPPQKLKDIRPGFFAQLWYFIRREFVLQLRMAKTLLLDQGLTLIAGAVLGLLFREADIHNVPEATTFGNIAVGLVGVVVALRSFGHNRVVFWRESASGINRVSYFCAVNLAYIPILVISPAVYLSIYYSLAAFLAPFAVHYSVFLCAWFYLSGLGYMLSLLMTPRNSQMAAIVTVVIMAMLSGGSPELCKLDDTFIATAFYNLSFSRWVAEAIFEIEAHENSEALSDIISRVQGDNHYDLNSFNTCIIALVLMGVGFRLIALLLLLFTKRGQQQ